MSPKKNLTHTVFPFILLISIYFTSCKKDEEKEGWETEILTPLLKSTLTIKDLVSDTLLQANSDSTLKLVYENHLYDMSLDSLFQLYDTSVTKNYNIDSISLYDQTISYPVTLAQIAANAGPPYDTLFQILNGSTFPIPAIPNQTSAPFIINADTLFQTMTLITGFLDVSIHNGLPIDITNLNLELKNTSNGASIANVTFPIIEHDSTHTTTVSLAGKTIEGNMTGQILSMSSPGSNGTPVLIDLTDSLLASLTVYDLHPSIATAVFPAQNLIDISQPFVFEFNGVELKEAKIKSGNVEMHLFSTLQDSVHFTYSLPNAKLNNVPFEINTVLPPAPVNGVSQFNHSYDFSGYVLDMANLPQDTVNTMYNTFIASVDSTGQMKTLSLSDSIYAQIGFVGLTPSYARGYLGQQTFSIGPSQLNIDIFKNITGSLQLQDVNMNIVTENSIGADARVDIGNLTSVNNRNGNTVVLNGSAVSNPIIITRASDNAGSVIPTNGNYQLNGSNSNAPAFISNLPDQLSYNLTLQTNPGGNNNYQDFIYADKLMKFNLDFEMPLNFIANNLTLIDTAGFQLNDVDIVRVKDGFLTLNADNGFPFDVTIQLYTINESNHITDSLFSNMIIAAAPVDGSLKVHEKKKSKLVIPVNENKINNFFTTKQIKIIARFNTKPNNTHLKIYSDYSIDFQLTGDFNYLAH